MMGLQGDTIRSEEKKLLISEQIAGVILFKRNITSFKQVHQLCGELKQLTTGRSFFIGVDREGGEVDRFSHLEDSFPYPSARQLSFLPPDHVFLIAQGLGEELNALGIDINFAPVLDLPQKRNDLFKTRSFGVEPKRVTLKGAAFCKGLKSQKNLFCLKHFPGHGNVEEDSHFVLPKDFRTFKEISVQLNIFKKVLERTSPPLIMTAHIQFPNVDSQIATFSKIFLSETLRDKWGYKGVIVSDDINMKALSSYSLGERVYLSLKAGCNLVLTCQDNEIIEDILLFFKNNPEKEKELNPFIKKSQNYFTSLCPIKRVRAWSEVQGILKHRKSKDLAEKLFNKNLQ